MEGRWIDRTNRIISYVCGILICMGLPSILSCFLVIGVGSPRWLQLPWSDFNDFVESVDGRVYVSASFYSKVFCYDREGRFIAAYPAPGEGHGGTALATDSAGIIYFKIGNYVATYDSNWNLVGEYHWDDVDGRNWILDENGKPKHLTLHGSPSKRVDQAARPGDLLFTDPLSARVQFTCSDGTILQRHGDSLIRLSQQGIQIHKYGTPWYLWIFKFPMPAGLAVPALMILVMLMKAKEKSGV